MDASTHSAADTPNPADKAEQAEVPTSSARKTRPERPRPAFALGWWVLASFLVIFLVVVVRIYLGVEGLLGQAFAVPGNVIEEIKTFLNPTPTVVVLPPALERVRSLARLESTSFFLSTVVEAERPASWPGTGQRLLLVAYGKVIAGVDLSKIQQEDVEVLDRRVIVHLPETEVLEVFLLEERTHVYDYDLGIFAVYDVTLEAEARQKALEEFRSTALENGILEEARSRAEWEVQRLLLLLGYESVVFR